MTNYTKAYLTTALWSSVDDDGNPLDDNYSIDDVDSEAIERADKDVTKFVAEIEKRGLDLGDIDSDTVMHDFWLTRNGHGAGFWDGDYPKDIGEQLTKLSHEFGEIALYVGDDNKLYF